MVVKIKERNGKKVCHQKKIKFENHKNCLEETRPENKKKYLEKMKLM